MKKISWEEYRKTFKECPMCSDLHWGFHANDGYIAKLEADSASLSKNENRTNRFNGKLMDKIDKLESDNKKLLECVKKIAIYAESELVKNYARKALAVISEVGNE